MDLGVLRTMGRSLEVPCLTSPAGKVAMLRPMFPPPSLFAPPFHVHPFPIQVHLAGTGRKFEIDIAESGAVPFLL